MANAATPMMQQYHRLKREAPADALMMFRLGDFYEMFFDDAKAAASILDVTLTQRQGTPMCGVPYHSVDPYISKLIRAGKRVAICDQVETPKPGQVVRREITHILSPGSIVDSHLLDAKRNNFCAALVKGKGAWGLAYLDLSTGECRAGELESPEEVSDTLGRVQPAELVVPAELRESVPPGVEALVIPYDDWAFTPDCADRTLLEHFKTQSLDGFGLGGAPLAAGAAGGLLHYLVNELRRDLGHVRSLATFARDDVLMVDEVTRANLELVQNTRGGSDHTLLAAIDRTVTSGGGRLLRQWLLQPLRDPDALGKRQGLVTFWKDWEREREDIRERLRGVRDLERLIARLSQGGGNARDLVALRNSLQQLPPILEAIAPYDTPLLKELAAQIEPLPDLVALFSAALADEPPAVIKDGGMIRNGYHAELDELRAAATEGKEWLAQLQAREAERTGIKSLKIRYNSVFGYFIEISKSNLGAVPEEYTRKQTMANAERYITPELKEMESKILGAEERARTMEINLFQGLRAKAVDHLASIQQTARALSAMDILAGWASLAQEQDYCRPTLETNGLLEIKDGRHPVIEQMAQAERFVPNDARLDDSEQRLVILTGPNMAGKSTYIRQVALIAILAHCGCFVPAREARISLLDRVFTRVGASDDLARGQSTFMVEMNETANILNHASNKSLVILDEIGRGTSTFDGLSIAWAVAEHLHNIIKCKALFATHYHELTELSLTLGGAKNFNVAVREWGDQVVFLRKIVPGGADKSYGIQVARLAGLPPSVLSRAKDILRQLEDDELDESGKPKLGRQTATEKLKRSRKRSGTGKAKPKSNGGKHLATEMDLFATGERTRPGMPSDSS